MQTDGWVKLGPFSGILYAEMIMEVLEKENIAARLAPDWVSAAYGVKGASVPGEKVFIWVREDDQEAAQSIAQTIISDGPSDS